MCGSGKERNGGEDSKSENHWMGSGDFHASHGPHLSDYTSLPDGDFAALWSLPHTPRVMLPILSQKQVSI